MSGIGTILYFSSGSKQDKLHDKIEKVDWDFKHRLKQTNKLNL